MASQVRELNFRPVWIKLHERKKELFQETKRWFDLLRWNTFMEVMTADGKNVHEYNRFFPIPQTERDKNPNLSQNPGY